MRIASPSIGSGMTVLSGGAQTLQAGAPALQLVPLVLQEVPDTGTITLKPSR